MRDRSKSRDQSRLTPPRIRRKYPGRVKIAENLVGVCKKNLFLHTRSEFPRTQPGLGNIVLHEGVKTTLAHDVRTSIMMF